MASKSSDQDTPIYNLLALVSPGVVDRHVVRQGYDNLERRYAADRSTDGRDVRILSEFLESVPGDPFVLDVGCGPGVPILRELNTNAAAVGLDFSREQLRLATQNVAEADSVQGDMLALPFADGTFDAVTAYHSVIHVPLGDHGAVIEEFARVLRPGGHLLLSEGPEEWTGTNPNWLDGGVEMQWHIAGEAATRTHLRDAGFEILDEWHPVDAETDGEEWIFFAARLEG